MLDGVDSGGALEPGLSYRLGGGSAGPGRSSAALMAAGNAIRSNGNAKESCRIAGLSWKYMIAPRTISRRRRPRCGYRKWGGAQTVHYSLVRVEKTRAHKRKTR